jgi:hypothetical protein
MTDDQARESSEAAEATEEGEQDVEPDYLEPLEEFAKEASADRERIKAVAETTKKVLSEQKDALVELQLRVAAETTEGMLLAAQIASLDAQLLMLDEQSETFTLFLVDLARLTVQNVEQLRNNDDELYDAIQEGAESDEDDEDAIITDSLLMPNDGAMIAAVLYEYESQLTAGVSQMEEGAERQHALGRIQQLQLLRGRVQEITVQESPEDSEPDQKEAPQAEAKPN